MAEPSPEILRYLRELDRKFDRIDRRMEELASELRATNEMVMAFPKTRLP